MVGVGFTFVIPGCLPDIHWPLHIAVYTGSVNTNRVAFSHYYRFFKTRTHEKRLGDDFPEMVQKSVEVGLVRRIPRARCNKSSSGKSAGSSECRSCSIGFCSTFQRIRRRTYPRSVPGGPPPRAMNSRFRDRIQHSTDLMKSDSHSCLRRAAGQESIWPPLPNRP